MARLKYDYNMLKSICDEGDVILLEVYTDKYITRDTRIIAKCIMCDNSFNKSLNKLHKQRNFGCESCAKKMKFDRIKNTMVEKYGVEYAAQNETCMNKMKATTFNKYGVENANQIEEIREKIKKTNLEKYGCEYGLQNEGVKEKRKITNLEKYGYTNPLQCEEIMEKCKTTCLKKYGSIYSINNEEVRNKSKATYFKKYGVEYGFQSEEIKNKIKKSNLEKYGVEYNLQREEIKEKIKQTCLAKYGFEHAMQCPEVMENNIKSSYYLKEYTLPSGNIIKIQGYEHFAINELIKNNINEKDIITGSKNVPVIWYIDNFEKKRRHFVDIFISSQNKCIEVKSRWTIEKNIEIVFLKQQAAKELGYLYEIWVYDKEGNILQTYN